MKDYDFLVLSPDEFEKLSINLLQEELGVRLERFKQGKDNGIDARYSENKKAKIILQAKRYKDYSPLQEILKEEVNKVIKLNPERYIITTSVALNPDDKSKIMEMFDPYILETSDILGKEDLNGLLEKYPKIERKYYKLWISSTEILNKIIHNKIVTKSTFDIDDIKTEMRRYVVNKSLYRAEKILRKNRVVVISGIPGIGKTTLAKALVYKFIAKSNVDVEFVSLNQNIQEAFDVYEEDKPQIFYYDDFLGSNFLVNNLNKGEDGTITQFIEKIHKSKNKYLVCTTREYILQQTKQTYEKINKNDILNISKYVIDLESYTKLVKAKILYNHLFFSKLNKEYFEKLINDKNYLRIINHPNFNPRLIEFIVKKSFFEKTNPDQYFEKIINSLNNPQEIWNDAFENQINNISQKILLVMTSCGVPITHGDLLKSVSSYTGKNEELNLIEFNKSLKELEDSFIKINIEEENKSKAYLIEFKNPSIQDFLVRYISNRIELIQKIISSSIFLNQIFNIFSYDIKEGKIKIPKELEVLVSKKIISNFNSLGFSTISKMKLSSGGQNIYKKPSNDLDKINYILYDINTKECTEIYNFIVEKIEKISYDEIDDNNLFIYIWILERLKNLKPKISFKNLLSTIIKNLNFISSLKTLLDMDNVSHNNFKYFLSLPDTKEKILSIVEDELYNATFNYQTLNDKEDFLENIKDVAKAYKLDIREKIESLEKEVLEQQEIEDLKSEEWRDKENEEENFNEEKDETKELEKIDDIFNSLQYH